MIKCQRTPSFGLWALVPVVELITILRQRFERKRVVYYSMAIRRRHILRCHITRACTGCPLLLSVDAEVPFAHTRMHFCIEAFALHLSNRFRFHAIPHAPCIRPSQGTHTLQRHRHHYKPVPERGKYNSSADSMVLLQSILAACTRSPHAPAPALRWRHHQCKNISTQWVRWCTLCLLLMKVSPPSQVQDSQLKIIDALHL